MIGRLIALSVFGMVLSFVHSVLVVWLLGEGSLALGCLGGVTVGICMLVGFFIGTLPEDKV
jgi:hypothetical protein